jgi:hypothetical protein
MTMTAARRESLVTEAVCSLEVRGFGRIPSVADVAATRLGPSELGSSQKIRWAQLGSNQ